MGMEVDVKGANPTPPPAPPGDHWTQYTDEGEGKMWWYYEGPLESGGAMKPIMSQGFGRLTLQLRRFSTLYQGSVSWIVQYVQLT